MTPLNVTLAILGISLLVIVHEGGHYFAARAFGMRVLRYSIGFGPILWRYQPKDSPTIFQVCAVPFLAYVQIDGMNPTEEIDPDDPGLYPNKGVFARIVTIFAGPFANYLAASVIVFGLVLSQGLPVHEEVEANEVGNVIPGTPAAAAGMQDGDLILSANGQEVTDVQGLIEATRERAGQPTEYVVNRGGEEVTLTITPDDQAGRGVIGVAVGSRSTYRDASLDEALLQAVVMPWRATVLTLEGLADLVKRRTTDGLTGPIGMTKMMTESVELGAETYLFRLMLISVALGLFNLLPLPALDGGRLAFLGYELITRRRANERVEMIVHTAGLLFLLGLLVFVSVKDVIG